MEVRRTQTIQHRDGRLTADQLNYALEAVDQFNRTPGGLPRLPILSKVKSSIWMTQEVDGETVDLDNRFFGDLVGLTGLVETSSLVELDRSRRAATTPSTEYANTAIQAEGVTISNLLTTFSLQPVPDGSLVWAFYRPFPRVSGSTDPDERGFVAAFTQTNHFDGACP